MSIHTETRIRELMATVANQAARIETLESVVSELTRRIESIESRPKPGRPPNDRIRTADGN